MPYGITQYYLQQWLSRLYSQPKLVIDLAAPKGCKAELTWVVVISQDNLPTEDRHLSQAMSLLEIEPATASCESGILTIRR